MTAKIANAFILAAGLGTRMRPLTDNRPKPLIEVAGRKLIDHAVDALVAANIGKAVVNAHYLADQIVAWAKSVSKVEISISDERGKLLDTGGGIKHALPLLGEEAFFVLNSDAFWIESDPPALVRLREAWNESVMDCLLLLCPPAMARGYDGAGDFHLDDAGRLTRRSNSALASYVYIGAYIVHARVFAGLAEEKFSMNTIWDTMIAQGRLFGLEHHGLWLHVGTPDAIALAEAVLDEI
jgi:MurNAc alpha-1-phosphate uridylyltransferase